MSISIIEKSATITSNKLPVIIATQYSMNFTTPCTPLLFSYFHCIIAVNTQSNVSIAYIENTATSHVLTHHIKKANIQNINENITFI
jgi:hypothetical protein